MPAHAFGEEHEGEEGGGDGLSGGDGELGAAPRSMTLLAASASGLEGRW